MPQSSHDDVLANWHKLIENLQVSSKEFYAAVQAGLSRRQVPALKTQVVVRNEGGVLSPRREYLRMTDGRVAFDLCAAPFGTGFFFSWWLVERKASWVAAYAVGFIFAARWIDHGLLRGLDALRLMTMPHSSLTEPPRNWSSVQIWWAKFWDSWFFQTPPLLSQWFARGLAAKLAAWCVALALVLTIVYLLARVGRIGPERAMKAIPILGWVYVKVFAPVTYYQLDTALMLRGAVHSAVLEAIDGITSSKGLRGLSGAERKPTMSKMMGAVGVEESPAEVSDLLEAR